MVMNRMPAALLAALVLAGCGGPSTAEYEAALERSYQRSGVAFAELAGLELSPELAGLKPVQEAGAVKGLSSTARAAADLAGELGGEQASVLTRNVIDKTVGIAADFGLEGADALKNSTQTAIATGWNVENIEVLASRKSGHHYIVQLRYDLFAIVGGIEQRVGTGLTHTLRLDDEEKFIVPIKN
jgi:hypothetical protein